MAKDVNFCVRMKGSWWNQVRSFRETGLQEGLVVFELPKKDLKKMGSYAHSLPNSITCPLIKVELDTGETEILCTSLTDLKKTPLSRVQRVISFTLI